MTPGRAVLALLLVVIGRPVAAQPVTPSQAAATRPANASAMYEFMLARRAESVDDFAAAEAAFRRALALDPKAADLHAELAAFYARQNRASDAVTAAEQAIALDADSEEGHRILGLVNAAWADGIVEGPAGGSEAAWRDAAITHLQRVQALPAMATDMGLQLTLARQLLAAERVADAVPLLEKLVSQSGPAGEPASMLAEALRSLGDVERATTVLEQAAAANPRFLIALGDIYERQSKFEEAAEAFDRGAKAMRTPGRELRLRRVNALLGIADGKGAERAVTALTEYLAATPADAAANYLLARAHLQRRDAAAAVTAAERALAIEPRHLPTLALLAAHYRERYDFAAIVALLTPLGQDEVTATTQSPADTARLLAELGGARQQLGDTAGAAAAFEKARARLPESAPLATALAEAYLQAGRPDDAIRVAQEARGAAAGDLGLIRVEALAGIRAGRAAAAISSAETAVGARRQQVPGAFVLADIYQDARRHADAIGVLTPLATAQPDDDTVAFRLAAAYETADRVPDAERTFRAILARDPLHANALNYLGYMLANRGLKLAEALTLVDRALVVEPGNPAYLDSRGWALFKLGRAGDAEAPLRQAATALGGSSVIQFHFAEVLAALGKRSEAAVRLAQALKGDGVDIDRAAVERRLAEVRRLP
ncbi:MAG: tetratricopeptide repeat protein [Acidobacteria bacterium]|nr:tetratricopeptide repeat protein [Acidobacteriota bacterium]